MSNYKEENMNRQHELKLNKLGEIVVSLIDDALEPEQEQHNVEDLNEITRLRNVLKRIANYGNHGRTALHTFEVPSYSKYGVEYKVKQLLDGGFTCECPSFKYNTGLDTEGHCKHQRDVIYGKVSNVTDLSYGLGAAEAHRRLTDIAKEGLIG